MEQIILTGIVVSAMPIGEYDKRLVLITKERGRITAFARGARRARNQFAAPSMPFSFGEFTLAEGRNSYSLVNVKIIKYFSESIKDFDKLAYGYYFLEMADYFAQEGLEAGDTLKLICQSLRALSNKAIPDRLIRYIYEFKTLVINGIYPDVFSCASCGNKQDLIAFSNVREGMLCKQCLAASVNKDILNKSTIYALQFIVCTPIERLFTFNVSEEVLNELKDIISNYMKHHVEKEFRSLEFIDD
ncbi:MAG: DNA repair protein RecO [Eubacterium sp.]